MAELANSLGINLILRASMNKFSEDDVHKHLHATGLEAVIANCPQFDVDEVEPCAEESDF
ncbi:hypothetical protein AO948_20895 [Pseudomonas aeruginosa]|nr:hypothetical protein AO948_20895 [Pseudomonas aeruginosa]